MFRLGVDGGRNQKQRFSLTDILRLESTTPGRN